MILTELGILIGFQLFYDYKIITSLIAYSCLSGLLAESFLGLLTYFLPKNMSITPGDTRLQSSSASFEQL
jgi:hypothetical protein